MKAERAEKNRRSSLEQEFPGSPITVRQQLMRSCSIDCLLPAASLFKEFHSKNVPLEKAKYKDSYISNVFSNLEEAETVPGVLGKPRTLSSEK